MSEEDRPTGSHFHLDDDNVNDPLLNDFQEVDLGSVDAPPAGNNQNIAIARDDEAAPAPKGNPVTGNIEIVIRDFKPEGSGISKHTIYKVETKVNGITAYANENYITWRRFSDFLGLYHKLYKKYLAKGVLIPIPPEKNAKYYFVSKVKAVTDIEEETKRARHLERFMNRVVRHDPLRTAPVVVDFLTNQKMLTSSNETVELSKIPSRLLQAGQKVWKSLTMYEGDGDEWFLKYQRQFIELEKDLHDFSERIKTLADSRIKSAKNEIDLAENLYRVAAIKDSRGRSSALYRLDNSSEMEPAEMEGTKLQHTEFIEGIQEYISLIFSLNLLFAEREKTWQSWINATEDVASKKAKKTNFNLNGQRGKSDQMTKEIEEATAKMNQFRQNFDKMSEAIKEEVDIFFIDYTAFMKSLITLFCDESICTTDQMVKHWRKVKTTAMDMYRLP